MKKVIALLLASMMVCAPSVSLGAPTDIIYNIINKQHEANDSNAMELLYSFKKKSAEAEKKEDNEIEEKTEESKPKDVKIIKNEKELDEVKKKEKIQGTLIGIDVSK